MRGVGCLCLTDECRGFMFCVVAFMYARVLDVCSIVCLRALEAGGGGSYAEESYQMCYQESAEVHFTTSIIG